MFPRELCLNDNTTSSPALNMRMRSILVAWILEVTIAFKYRCDTFLLACETLDRYLATATVERDKFQLCGTVALMLAAKYQETHVARTEDYVDMCNYSYTESELLQTERIMLQALNFTVEPYFVMPTREYLIPTVLYLVLYSNRKKMQKGIMQIKEGIHDEETECGKKIARLLEDDVLNLKRITKKITWLPNK